MSRRQQSVGYTSGPLQAGYASNTQPDNTYTCKAQDTLYYGRFVKKGATSGSVETIMPVANVSAATDITGTRTLFGVTMIDGTRVQEPSINDTIGGFYIDAVQAGSLLSVRSMGPIQLNCETAMNNLSDIYIRHAARVQVQTLVFDADLITGNIINGEIGGVPITEVLFDTDNETTLTAIADAIFATAGNTKIASAVSDDTDTITVTSILDVKDQNLTGWVVTGGASQAAITIDETAGSVKSSMIGSIRNDGDGGTATEIPDTMQIKIIEAITEAGPIAANIDIK